MWEEALWGGSGRTTAWTLASWFSAPDLSPLLCGLREDISFPDLNFQISTLKLDAFQLRAYGFSLGCSERAPRKGGRDRLKSSWGGGHPQEHKHSGAVEQAALKRANMQRGRGVWGREGWLRPFSVGPALPVWRSVSTSSFFSPPEATPPYSSYSGETLKIFRQV